MKTSSSSRSRKDQALPSVRISDLFKDQVVKACDSVGLSYGTVVTHLLAGWVSGDIQLRFDLDSEFVAHARQALQSEETQSLLNRVAQQYHPKRIYKNTVRIS
ncbi:MAG: hypothetical protein Q8O95_04505 [bacterium]|nr:hypothetical protein [bacterium]